MGFLKWLSAWLLFLLLLAVMAKTAAGKTLLYYLLWLAVFFLLVSHYQEIVSIFSAAGIVPEQQPITVPAGP